MKYLSATDEEALAAFQLLSKLEGIIPALEPAHALAKVSELAPNAAEGSPDGASTCPAAATRTSRRSPISSKGRQIVTTRIDTRFAELKAEGRAAFVTFVMAGDPDLRHLARDRQGAAEGRRRRDRDRHALHRSDGRRPGDPGRGPARAEGRHDADARRSQLVRDFREADDKTPIVLMGYYNPIYIYGVDAFLAAMRRPPASMV